MNRHPVTPAIRRVAPRAWPAIVAAAMFSLAPSSVLALDGDELLRKVDRNLNPESYEMYRKLINIEPDGRKKEFVLFSVKKGRENILALFLDPPSEKGRATLRLGDNMWSTSPKWASRSALRACSP